MVLRQALQAEPEVETMRLLDFIQSAVIGGPKRVQRADASGLTAANDASNRSSRNSARRGVEWYKVARLTGPRYQFSPAAVRSLPTMRTHRPGAGVGYENQCENGNDKCGRRCTA
jgi:hypothetical protein